MLRPAPALRDCFLKTLWDTDATDFTDAMRTEKNVIKRLLSVVSVKSVYKRTRSPVDKRTCSPVDKKDNNYDLRNTISG